MDRLTLAHRSPQMGDRVQHHTQGKAFTCHVDDKGVRLVCREDSPEPWLTDYLAQEVYQQWSYVKE